MWPQGARRQRELQALTLLHVRPYLAWRPCLPSANPPALALTPPARPARPVRLQMLGMHGTVYANYAVNEADLLIALGVRFDDRVTGARCACCARCAAPYHAAMLCDARCCEACTARRAFGSASAGRRGRRVCMVGQVDSGAGAERSARLALSLPTRAAAPPPAGKLEAFASRARVVHIDIDPAEIHKNKEAHVPIFADVKPALQVGGRGGAGRAGGTHRQKGKKVA